MKMEKRISYESWALDDGKRFIRREDEHRVVWYYGQFVNTETMVRDFKLEQKLEALRAAQV